MAEEEMTGLRLMDFEPLLDFTILMLRRASWFQANEPGFVHVVWVCLISAPSAFDIDACIK
jgi:hypothetical protein